MGSQLESSLTLIPQGGLGCDWTGELFTLEVSRAGFCPTVSIRCWEAVGEYNLSGSPSSQGQFLGAGGGLCSGWWMGALAWDRGSKQGTRRIYYKASPPISA